jgi:hypothetical protein
MIQVGIIVAGSVCPIEGFKSRLRDLGWIEGKGISFQVRAAEGQLRLLPQFAEMVKLGVDLIAVIGAVAVRAGARARTGADRSRGADQPSMPKADRRSSRCLAPADGARCGGLIAYGTSLREAVRQMARHADDILRGTSPGNPPIKAALAHEHRLPATAQGCFFPLPLSGTFLAGQKSSRVRRPPRALRG